MIHKTSLFRPSLVAALLCGVAAVSALAQDPGAPSAPGAPGPLTTPAPLLPPSAPPPPPPQMQHGSGHPNPLFDALDTNHDGTISAEEIANASGSLRALLKNGSDHLTRDDLRPAPPAHPTADAADQPRPKIGAVRPHGPPPREDEETPAQPEARRAHPPRPMDDQADADFERPHPRHERPSRHERPARMEDDEMDNDAPPHHPEARREEREARPHHAPRPENAGERADAPGSPHHQGPPPRPLFDALDANHDGTISAEEIANAPTVLKALLKNGSDHLTRDDLRPQGPPPGDR